MTTVTSVFRREDSNYCDAVVCSFRPKAIFTLNVTISSGVISSFTVNFEHYDDSTCSSSIRGTNNRVYYGGQTFNESGGTPITKSVNSTSLYLQASSYTEVGDGVSSCSIRTEQPNIYVNLYTAQPGLNLVGVDNNPTALTYTKKIIRLPPAATTTGKLFIIKDYNNNADVNQFFVCTSNGEFFDTNTTFRLINNESGCLSLMSDGTRYQILKYYPGDTYNDFKNNITTARKYLTYGINYWRQPENNDYLFELPAPQSGKFVFVAYSNIYNTNWMFFTAPSGRSIDKRYGSYPGNYIVNIRSDSTRKALGISFISDGTYWYIISDTGTYCWGWDDSTEYSQPTYTLKIISPSYSSLQLIGTNRNTSIKGLDIVMPNFSSSIFPNSSNGTIIFVKIGASIQDGQGVRFHTFYSGQTTNYFGDETQNNLRLFRGCNGGTSGHCIWFAVIRRPGQSYLNYFPVVTQNEI